MAEPITGGCRCGAVRFVLATPPLAARACWCRDCQYVACGNASVNLICTAAGLTVAGETTTYESLADSGNRMRRRFCPVCGTPLFSAASDRPDFVVVRAGALDDPNIAGPESVIWTGSAPRWAWIDPGLPCFAGQVAAAAKR